MDNTAATSATVTVSADDITQFPEYHAAIWIWTICSPFLIILGTIGNILSIIVLTRKSMRESTVSTYLTVLAFNDMAVLYTGLLRHWIRIVFSVDLQKLSAISCKIHLWMVYFTLSMSAWLLVAVTVERFVSVWVPHKVKYYCSKVITYIVISVIAVMMLMLGSHSLYGMGDLVVTSDGVSSSIVCTSLWDEYDHFKTRIWPLIALLVFSLVPFIVLIVANISIIYKVVVSRRQSRRVHPITSQQCQSQVKNTSSMTIMLLTLNAVYFVCTLPICIFLIWRPSWITKYTPYRQAVLILFEAAASILMYTNNSINFLMYCISGSRFRNTLKGMIWKNEPRRKHSVTRTNYTETVRRNITDISVLDNAVSTH